MLLLYTHFESSLFFLTHWVALRCPMRRSIFFDGGESKVQSGVHCVGPVLTEFAS